MWELGYVGGSVVGTRRRSLPSVEKRRRAGVRVARSCLENGQQSDNPFKLLHETFVSPDSPDEQKETEKDSVEEAFLSEGGEELFRNLTRAAQKMKHGKRDKMSTNTIRVKEAKERLTELSLKHGKGKALKKGVRSEASEEFTKLIAACGRSGLYKLALDVYDEAVRSIGMDASLASAALRGALSAKYFGTAMKIFEFSSQQGITFPDNVYSLTVSGLLECGKIEAAMDFKQRLEQRGGKLELFSYNALIQYYASRGNLRKVLEVVQEAEKVGHTLTHNTESLILRAVFRTGLGLPGCLEWIEEKNYEVSRAALQAMLEESLEINDRAGASEILELMRTNGKWARVRTYNAFIEYFANNEDVVGAMQTFKSLKVGGVVPSSQTYFLLALAAVKCGDKLEETGKLLAEAAEGILATYHAYNTRAILAARAGHDVRTVFEEMYEEGLAPDDRSYYYVFDAMSRREEGDMEHKAIALLPQMQKVGLRGSRKSMNALLQVLCKSGAAEKAVELFRSMVIAGETEMDVKPDYETYELVLEACGNGKRMDLAVGVFRELENLQITPTVALYSTLVLGFGLSNDFESALGVWKEMKERGLRPNRTAYRRMVDACLRHPSGIGYACKLLEEMTAMGFSMEQEYYDTLIKGYGRARELEKVVDRFRQSQRAGAQIDEVTLGAVLNACEQNESLPTADEALERLIGQGIRPTRQVMEYLAEGKTVSNSKNKIMQDVFGLSGVDIVRGYLPKLKGEDYDDFKTLLEGSLKEEQPVVEDPVPKEEGKKEVDIRKMALERPTTAKDRERRRRMKRRN